MELVQLILQKKSNGRKRSETVGNSRKHDQAKTFPTRISFKNKHFRATQIFFEGPKVSKGKRLETVGDRTFARQKSSCFVAYVHEKCLNKRVCIYPSIHYPNQSCRNHRPPGKHLGLSSSVCSLGTWIHRWGDRLQKSLFGDSAILGEVEDFMGFHYNWNGRFITFIGFNCLDCFLEWNLRDTHRPSTVRTLSETAPGIFKLTGQLAGQFWLPWVRITRNWARTACIPSVGTTEAKFMSCQNLQVIQFAKAKRP